MKFYSIFDDYGTRASSIIRDAGMDIDLHPYGVPRPSPLELKRILENYDGVIIGTGQKITEEMFERVETQKIIASASVGTDHINVPACKEHLVHIINTPKANAQSVAEYTIACALCCVKRLSEGRNLYFRGMDNKKLSRKPEDLFGKVIGVIGAGNVSVRIMDYASVFGMRTLCWTPHPEKHSSLNLKGVRFVELDYLVKNADVISVNLPNNPDTEGMVSQHLVEIMKDDAIFISVSRLPTVDYDALLSKAQKYPNFYVCLDVDVNAELVSKISCMDNFLITPHVAGSTKETRERMFIELAENIVEYASEQ